MRRINPMAGVMSMARPAVPPGGFAGVATQTPVARSTTFSRPPSMGTVWFTGRVSRAAPKRRRKSKKAAPMKKRKRTGKKRSSGKKAKRFVKGSAAAKRFMARLRAKRKK